MASKDELPNFTPSDYVKFFGAGALAATSTHGVRTGLSSASNETGNSDSG